VPAASRELTHTDNTDDDGFWVSNDDGEPSGYVTYREFATVLGEGIVSDAEADDDGEEELSDAIPAQ
jgi:hypothetical protein